MMKYEPEEPSKDFIYCKWEFKNGNKKQPKCKEENKEDDEDADFDDDEENEKEDL